MDVKATSNGAGTRNLTFTTAGAGERLVAFVASDGPPASASQTVTVSGGGLAWSLVKRANTRFGTAEIWTAAAAAKLTNAVLTSTQSASGFHQSLTIVAFIGSGGIGASAINSGATGAQSVSLTTTGANSLVYGVGDDWDNAIARTLGAGQTLQSQNLAPSGDTFWVQSQTSPVAAAATLVTLTDTAPTTDQWNYAAVEILSLP